MSEEYRNFEYLKITHQQLREANKLEEQTALSKSLTRVTQKYCWMKNQLLEQ